MTNPMDLTGRTVLVTGASSGIGRGCAIVAAELGAKVVLTGRSQERLEETREQMSGASHAVVPFDLERVDDISGWMKEVASREGTLSGVVHAAGAQVTLPLRATTSTQVDGLFRINVTSGLMLAKGLRQKGVVADKASVVFIASIYAFTSKPAIAIYSGTKGALVSMTRSLALELARESIRVNCIAPGLVPSAIAAEMESMMTAEQFAEVQRSHPIGVGTPRDVGNAAAFLMADSGRWITGTTLVIDGGYTAQ